MRASLQSVVVATALLIATNAAANEALPDATEFDRLQHEFQRALDQQRRVHGFPGATAAFILKDGRVGVAATGFSDVEASIPMTPDDRMFSGSIGKTFVSAVALSLVSDGVLDLDAPIATWLGGEAWFKRLPNGGEIVLSQLLNHTSGTRDHLNEAGFLFALTQRIKAGRLDDPFMPEELVRYVLRKEPYFAPGEGWHYTDTGYILVGLIVEKASGRSYYELLQERFLDPLHLKLTTPSNTRRIPGLVPGYLEPGNPFQVPEKSMLEPGVLYVHPGSEWTGGGLITNPQDLVRWGKALYRDEVLGDAMTRAMLMRKHPTGSDRNGDHYGLGVHIFDTRFGTGYGHGGWYPGYHSQLVYFADRHFAVAIQINRDFDNPRMQYLLEIAEPVAGMLARLSAP